MTGLGGGGHLAAVMLSVAAYRVSRLISARPRGRATERDVDTAHCAEGVAMAGMLAPSLGLLPGVMWEAAFAAAAGWFAFRAIRGAPPGRRPDSVGGALPAAPDGKRRHAEGSTRRRGTADAQLRVDDDVGIRGPPG